MGQFEGVLTPKYVLIDMMLLWLKVSVVLSLDIIMTAVSKWQTYVSYKGEHQTLTKLSIRHHIWSVEICHTTISESTITMLMCKGRNFV